MSSRVFTRAYWTMVWEMSYNNFRLKDQGTFLGFIWTLLNPLIYFVVLYNLFIKWMGQRIPDFPLYLLIGIVQWGLFAGATSQSISSIIGGSSYIKSINFPRSVLILSSVFSVLFGYIFEILTLVVVVCVIKGNCNWTLLALVPVTLLMLYLVISLSFILGTIGVYFLDMSRIWGIAMSVGMFLTPLFYDMNVIAPQRRYIIMANPMTPIVTATRSILLEARLPEMGGLWYVLGISTFFMVCGAFLFKSRERYFAERV